MPHNAGKITSAITLMLVVSIALVSFPAIRPVNGESIVYIRADGTVEGTNKISRNGNVYTFTSDINAGLVVERNNIVVDGGGFTLRGINSFDAGINMNYRANVTIRNLKVAGFSYGINLTGSSGCTIANNTVTETLWYGICLQQSSNHNTVTGTGNGIVLTSASNNVLTSNNKKCCPKKLSSAKLTLKATGEVVCLHIF